MNKTFNEWLDIWLDQYKKLTIKQKSYNRYKELISLHIYNELGFYYVKDLTLPILQNFITKKLENGNKITNQGLSASTVNTLISILKMSLKIAVDIDLINLNPAKNIIRPKRLIRN